MDDESNKKGQGEVVEISGWKASHQDKVASITSRRGGVRMACISGGPQVQEDDQRLDEREEWEKFWESFRDFER